MASTKSIRKSTQEAIRLYRHFRADLVRERWGIARAMGALLVGVFAQLLEPWPLKFVVDSLLTPPASGDPTGAWTALPVTTALVMAGAVYVVCVAVSASAEYYQSVGFAMIGNRIISRLRSRLYSHLQALPLTFHNKSRHGDLLVRMVGDIKLLRDVAVTAVLPLLGSVLVLLGMAAVMLWLNWKLALVALAVLPLFMLSTVRLGRRIHEAARKQRQREGAVAAQAAEAISAMHLVQALSLESHFEKSFSVNENRNVADEVKTRKLAARLTRTTSLLIAVSTAIVLVYGGHQVLQSAMTVGSLIVFLTYMKRGLRPLKNFAKYAARLSKASAATERVFELLETDSATAGDEESAEAPRFRGAIEFNNVHYRYDAAAPVLTGFSATIAPGECVAIVGSSGVGKSTLLSLLLRFYEPERGQVSIDGVPIDAWSRTSLRSQTSIVLQDTVLFAGTIADNIAYGTVDANRQQIILAAKLAAAHDFITALPAGYDTPVGERGVTLSHGQRQRIAIARAAVRDAPILLLDEPATALDQQNKQLVREALARLASGRTTLMVTHDLNDAVIADRILLVDGGRVAEQGTHEELMRLDGRYAHLYRVQTQTPSSRTSDPSHATVS